MTMATVFAGVIALIADIGFRIARVRRALAQGAAALVVVLAVVGFVLAPYAALLLRMSLSRRREYLADAGAAEILNDPEAMALALRRLELDTTIGPLRGRVDGASVGREPDRSRRLRAPRCPRALGLVQHASAASERGSPHSRKRADSGFRSGFRRTSRSPSSSDSREPRQRFAQSRDSHSASGRFGSIMAEAVKGLRIGRRRGRDERAAQLAARACPPPCARRRPLAGPGPLQLHARRRRGARARSEAASADVPRQATASSSTRTVPARSPTARRCGRRVLRERSVSPGDRVIVVAGSTVDWLEVVLGV